MPNSIINETVDKSVLKFRSSGTQVEVTGFNRTSAEMIYKLAIHNKELRQAARSRCMKLYKPHMPWSGMPEE